VQRKEKGYIVHGPEETRTGRIKQNPLKKNRTLPDSKQVPGEDAPAKKKKKKTRRGGKKKKKESGEEARGEPRTLEMLKREATS